MAFYAVMDQCQYLINFSPTPPLTQQNATDNLSLRLMLGWVGIAQIKTLIHHNTVNSLKIGVFV